MCESIRVKDEAGTHYIESFGEASHFFRDGLVFNIDMKTTLKENDCLCYLDMEATAAKSNYVATNQHGGDPFVWHFKRP